MLRTKRKASTGRTRQSGTSAVAKSNVPPPRPLPSPPRKSFTTLSLPPVGAVWPGEGGRFAGIVFNDDGKPSHYLIHHEVRPGLDWNSAVAWARGVKHEGHGDYTLPDRLDAAVLNANRHALKVDRAWDWLSEQYGSNADYAWVQSPDGSQSIYHKGGKYRARAVRRLPIQ